MRLHGSCYAHTKELARNSLDTMASAQLEIPGYLQQRQEEKCGVAVPEDPGKAIARAAAAGLGGVRAGVE